ncbi:MAG: 4-(cytidine 5'-diphospho)-2-C-methyl-D-erythritol kinase [Acidobacteria bacterium]|jgi:4-diphosphocytidyl-2-C-methyl-D-erythritol kinase|nr:MAG: 4-(cytidine 5'-diphospho)-2-C-methyl-D-erythritol kinase [Acidobacteriota bacterium]GIU82153.1 MAG: 4-diphosphocytidyl-2-C-methyl-D-erythritol kinase [Pyrinomonadaceae bacterium]
MQTFSLPSFAKINWFLRVLGKRDDGFHEICTAFQTISLCDVLTFSEIDSDEIIFTCSEPSLSSRENIIFRATEKLKEKFGIKLGARIHLEKRIPFPGGLGGGSSNCAIALIGLAKLWNLKVEINDFCEIGAQIGSDVPFFFYGGTCFATGRGTEIFPTEDIQEKYMLIVTPNVFISTKEAYQRLNADSLTKNASKANLKICCDELKRLQIALSFKNDQRAESLNDFEKLVFESEPEVKKVKEALLNEGAKFAQMSGSGSSIFAIFENEITRQTALKNLGKYTNWKKFAVTTVDRENYRKTLGLEKL